MFDLRSLEHSTIIYEPSEKSDKDKCMFLSFLTMT
jgi:WD repeat-containing protein 68